MSAMPWALLHVWLTVSYAPVTYVELMVPVELFEIEVQFLVDVITYDSAFQVLHLWRNDWVGLHNSTQEMEQKAFTQQHFLFCGNTWNAACHFHTLQHCPMWWAGSNPSMYPIITEKVRYEQQKPFCFRSVNSIHRLCCLKQWYLVPNIQDFYTMHFSFARSITGLTFKAGALSGPLATKPGVGVRQWPQKEVTKIHWLVECDDDIKVIGHPMDQSEDNAKFEMAIRWEDDVTKVTWPSID